VTHQTVDCVIEDARWDALDLPAIADAAIAATLQDRALDPAAFEVSVLACDDSRIAALNETFRDKGKPTNVLSWPSAERAATTAGAHPAAPTPDAFGATELGDIAMSYDTCASEAAVAGKNLADHATHLLVHATLHLLGYDHENDADGDLMESLETQILGKMGLTDPYSS